MPSVSLTLDAESSRQSEQVALNGHRALAPLISGAVSGTIIGLAWIVGLLMYAYQRWRDHRAVRAAGLRSHRELDVPPPKQEAFIPPPDPAVIQGVRAPGERVVFGADDPRAAADARPRYAKTVPVAQAEKSRRQDDEIRPSTVAGQAFSAPELTAKTQGATTPTSLDRSAARSGPPLHHSPGSGS